MAAETFFTGLIAKVNSVAALFITQKISAVISGISTAATSMFIIYIALWAIAMMRGSVQEPLMDGVMRITRMAVIGGLALVIGNYQQYISNFLWTAPDEMAKILVGGGETSESILDAIYTAGMSLGDKAFEKMGTAGFSELDTAIGLFFEGVVIYAGSYLLTIYAAVLIVMSKIGLAVLLGVGPIFVILALFQGTQKFFESWFGMTMNFVFMSVITASIISFMHLTVFDFVQSTADGDLNLRNALELLALGGISTIVFVQVPAIASSLGGGASLSTLNAVGRAWNAASSQFKRTPSYSGKRSQVVYKSNAERLGGAALAGARKARNLYRASRKNSVSNG